MRGLGTIINVLGIVGGGLLGLLFGKKIHEKFRDTLMTAIGVCVLFLGIGGTMEQMLHVNGSQLSSSGSLMVIISMALGTVIGELLNLDGKIERFGEWLKVKTKSQSDNLFVEAFVSASLTVCIGAMAVVGSIRDGIYGDYTILAAKALLDAIIIMIMTAASGKGCIFSAIPVALFQGFCTLIAVFIQPILTEEALSNLSYVGSILIFCVGVNIVWDKKIRVANILPSIVIAVCAAFLHIGN